MNINYLIKIGVLYVANCVSFVTSSNTTSMYVTSSNTTSMYVTSTDTKSMYKICPLHTKGQRVNYQDLVGSWMTVYTQPKSIDCFKFDIRATTDLEREQYIIKYGNFNGRVVWDNCLLQVATPMGKHFLQGDGSQAGIMENIIIMEEKKGTFKLQNQSADQWTIFGRRGSEVLIIRDCYGETAAAFARAPYWPTAPELSAIFHRNGIAVLTHGRLLCEPLHNPTRQHHINDPY